MRRFPLLLLALGLAACTPLHKEEWDNAIGIGLPATATVQEVASKRYGDVLATAHLPKDDFPAFSQSVTGFEPWKVPLATVTLRVGDDTLPISALTCTLYTSRRQEDGKELYLLWDERQETVRAALVSAQP